MSETKNLLIQRKIKDVSRHVSGISYYYTDGKIENMGCLGYENIEKGIKLSPKSVWSLQSITKNISASVVAWLVDKSLTTYDTTINPTLRLEFASPNVTRNVTIKNCLSHTTGLPGDAGLEASEYYYGLSTIYRSVRKYELLNFCDASKPCRKLCKMRYSNLGITIGLNAAVANAGLGDSYTDMIKIQKRFATRIGMTDVLIGTKEIIKNNHLVQPYISINGKYVAKKLDVVHQFAGADGIFTTIKSLSMFLKFHLNRGLFAGESVVRREILDELYVPVSVSDANVNGDFYGMGTAIYSFDHNGEKLFLFGHGGAYSNGFLHQIVYNATTGIAVAILTNTFDAYATALAFYVYFVLYSDEKYAEEQYQKILRSGTDDLSFFTCDKTITDYVYNTRFNRADLPGKYYNQTDGLIVIDDDYNIRVGKTSPSPLNFEKDSTWFDLETTFLLDVAVINVISLRGKLIGIQLLYACFTSTYIKIAM